MMKRTVDISAAEKKLIHLKELLSSMGSISVAFSGGVDSTFLLTVAKEVLGQRVIAVTATSPTYPEREMEEAISLAESLDVKHIIISSNELEVPGFSENSPNRCFYCKTDLFEKIRLIAAERGIRHVADGSNSDDTRDHRPGRKAAKEQEVRSPLIEAGLSKEEIRYLSKKMGITTWNKPSFACLSSRIPYGEEITEAKLRKIEEAEILLREMGFTQIRVRHHNGIARLEFIPEEIARLSNEELRLSIDRALRKLGFQYVTVDLQGYRTGSMNEVLNDERGVEQ
jgi:uncharacterized protein